MSKIHSEKHEGKVKVEIEGTPNEIMAHVTMVLIEFSRRMRYSQFSCYQHDLDHKKARTDFASYLLGLAELLPDLFDAVNED